MDAVGGSNLASWGRIPEHVAVIMALAALDYEFDEPQDPGPATRTLGFGPDSVVEVIGGATATVSLLVSASPRQRDVVASSMALIAVASATGVDFLDWLTTLMRTRGRDAPWAATRRFNRRRVRAELLTSEAMLLTVEGSA